MTKKIGLLAMIFVLSVVVSGCGQKTLTEKQMEKAFGDGMGQDVNVDLGSGEVKITTEDGLVMEVGGDISLPADFPDDVYVIEGKIISAMKNVMGAGHQIMVGTTKSVQEVKEIYEEELAKNKWEIGSSLAMGDIVMLSANKDDRTVSITISIDEEDENMVIAIINVVE